VDDWNMGTLLRLDANQEVSDANTIIGMIVTTFFAFSALTLLLGGRKGIQPVKILVVGFLHSYLSGARCRFAYGPADSAATHCLLLQ